MARNISILAVALLLCGCKQAVSEYAGLEYRGGKNICITAFASLDTMLIDAGASSMEGRWHLSRGKLLFLDKYVVGVREYDLQGNFLGHNINRGRGPNEMIAPASLSATTNDGGLTMIDNSWYIFHFDSLYQKSAENGRFLADLVIETEFDWNHLLQNPDPEVKQMYELFWGSGRVKIADDTMILPIITEHVHFNGYNTGSQAKGYWAQTHNMIFVDAVNNATGELFGTYPPVYQQNNIPAFAGFDFDTDDERIYIGFAADSLIYVRDVHTGKLLNCFGCAAPEVSGRYPSTSTFEEYEKVCDDHLSKFGHYTRLVRVGDRLLREYKKDGNAGYGLQIYENGVLIGNIDTAETMQIIGLHDGIIYAALPADLDREQLRILKFTL